jgi:hypothetical protein
MGKGGSKAPSSQTVTQTNIPKYLEPYVKDVAERAQAASNQDYVPYSGQRIAGFTDQQRNLQNQIANMQTPGQFAQATQGAQAGMGMGYAAGLAGLNQAFGYQPGQFRADQVQSPELQYFQMNQPGDVQAQQLQNFSMRGAQGSYNPNLQNYQMQRPEDVQAQQLQNYSMQGAQDNTNYMAQLEKYQMQSPQQVAAERAASSEFGGADASKYMSPFQQQVSDIAAREVQRRADIDKSQGAMSSIGRGTFGGSRQALLQAEADRNTQQQIGDIYAKGQQSAYENAQSQFERDQARRMASQQLNVQSGLQAGLANQQAGLTAGQANLNALLGVQSLGTTSNLQNRLANLSNQQQANVQNLASQLQTQGLSSQQALQAALANQQAGLSTNQQNLAANLQTQQLGTQTGLQMALANLSNEQQANVQNLASQLQTQGLSSDQALRAALANQQTGLTTNQQNLQAALGVQSLGANQNLTAQQLNQAANLQAQQNSEQARQYAAGLGSQIGLAGMQQGLAGSQLLGNLGLNQQNADIARYGLQTSTAAQQQALNQQYMDTRYQDFLNQRQYPWDQLYNYSGIIRGLPQQPGQTSTTYQQPPSLAAQLIGGAGSLATAAKAFGAFARGGAVRNKYSEGLAAVRLKELVG